MSIPLDNIRDWIEGLLPCPSVLYLFLPHGSKNISDFNMSRTHTDQFLMPTVIMHDQEPLNYKLYANLNNVCHNIINEIYQSNSPDQQPLRDLDCAIKISLPNLNLQYIPFFLGQRYYDNPVLIHSEKNSQDLELYEQAGYLCVHYWAHAMIARDWYRFAKDDHRLKITNAPAKKFLVYCRDWSDGREYRLKFLDLLIEHELLDSCLVNMMHTNSSSVHYKQHKFINEDFVISQIEKLEQIAENRSPGHASAEYSPTDFVNTKISVVLETVFDDVRIHLTEKTLRPIACGHAFLLAAGPGSLAYLRQYGFKTFSPLIDESYDLETNSCTRLKKIVTSMQQLNLLTESELDELQEIAAYNQQHFFSDKFATVIKTELMTNLEQAYNRLSLSTGKKFMALLDQLSSQNVDLKLFQNFDLVLDKIKQSCQ